MGGASGFCHGRSFRRVQQRTDIAGILQVSACHRHSSLRIGRLLGLWLGGRDSTLDNVAQSVAVIASAPPSW
jgi:hypothetical protein